MKFAGCLMLISGWMIALAALVLIPQLGLRAAFIAAGLLVEIIGLGLIARGEVNEQRQAQALAASIDGTRSASNFGGSRSGFAGSRSGFAGSRSGFGGDGSGFREDGSGFGEDGSGFGGNS